MNNTRRIAFGCCSCSTFFTDHKQHLADCLDDQNPPHEIIRLFSTATNVYQVKSAENPIRSSISLDDEVERVQVQLATVYCAGCRTECGWKITAADPHPEVQRGQYLLKAKPIDKSQARRIR